jgi:23S rRNA pseudouridine1911/1915/1917 synthase
VKEEPVSLMVGAEEAGLRLDVFVSQRGLALTRSQVERLAKSGRVCVSGRAARAGCRLAAGEEVEVWRPVGVSGSGACGEGRPAPEAIALEILFEDDDVLVVNKRQGMVVHPGAGRRSGTLVNALLAHTRSLASGPAPHRPGIVHRLDRDTSGLMVVAKSEAAYAELSRQVRERELERRYLGLVWGRVREDRLLIDVPIARHVRDRKRMAAVPRPADARGGRRVRSAVTEVRVLERLGPATLVEARLATGRTHQIRVHLAHRGHPVVGDQVYGLRRARQEKAALQAEALAQVRALAGHALHAQTLCFRHPVSGQELRFSVPPPMEMARLLGHLRRKTREGR